MEVKIIFNEDVISKDACNLVKAEVRKTSLLDEGIEGSLTVKIFRVFQKKQKTLYCANLRLDIKDGYKVQTSVEGTDLQKIITIGVQNIYSKTIDQISKNEYGQELLKK